MWPTNRLHHPCHPGTIGVTFVSVELADGAVTTDGRRVWLVDATTYRKPLDLEVQRHKDYFFRLETHARRRHPGIGVTAPRGTRTYSAGLLRIGTILAASGCSIRYMRAEDAEAALVDGDGADRPDIVGFGAVCPTVPLCAELARALRARFPGVRAVLGCAHAVVARELTLARFPGVFDSVAGAFEADAAAALAGVPRTALATPERDLDYGLLPHPLRTYAINLMTQTGCPFTCTYCQDRLVPRERSALDGGLAGILQHLPGRTPVHFCDSVLGGGARRALEVCDRLAELDHSMVLSCDLRPELVSEPLLRALERAGFAEVRLGLDSADEDVLATARRGAGPDRLPRVLRTIRETSGLYVSIYMVTGLPGSTPATLDRNLDVVACLLEERLADQIKHHVYVPYPTDQCPTGTPEVRIREHDWSRYDRNSYPVYSLDGLDTDQIWASFLAMEEGINVSWTKALHVEPSTVESLPRYPDYNDVMYLSTPASPGTR
jgi:hypothetical protein